MEQDQVEQAWDEPLGTGLPVGPVFASPMVDKLFAALAVAQGEIKNAIRESENPHFRSRYADLASVWDACRAPLSRNGLCVLQVTRTDPDGGIRLVTVLGHASGQYWGGDIPVRVEEAKGVNPLQALGSVLTYLRRYALGAIVGVAPEDDDGESSGAGRVPQARQAVTREPVTEDDGAFSSDAQDPTVCTTPGCGRSLTTGQYAFSVKSFGRGLCPNCQKVAAAKEG